MMRTLTLPSRLARTSCSVLALATVLVVGATPAAAQSFLGIGTPTNGAATTITTGVNTTNIAVTTPQTVIDWVPTDNAIANNTTIAFQNSGTTATFAGPGNFAVLNRINPADSTRSITMNGTIQTSPPLGFGGAHSGSIYFYTPGGFVLGASSIINVGSLVLSASPITVDGSGNFITGLSNTVTFGQATNPLARILTTAGSQTSAGSQINATAGDAYVAMVAPRVEHRGSINVSGSAALVAAEAATINFSPSGLFDIQVIVGTTDSQGVSVNGNITGSASTNNTTDARRAYLIAVPKNTALTMAISSGADLGFAVAGAANAVGNAVILSAGRDIVAGEIGGISSAAGALANISSTGLNATSAVRAAATNFAEFDGATGQANSFASDLSVTAPGRAWLTAQGTGTSITIVRDLVLNSDVIATSPGGSANGGSAALYTVADGAVTVNGTATVTANATGQNSSTAGVAGGNGAGGFATIQNQSPGGNIHILGNALISASGTGGSGLVTGANGGSGTGGYASIRTFSGGDALTVGGSATIQSMGTGGAALGCAGCIGGAGTGGTATSYASEGGTVNVTGMLRLNADGRGGAAATGRGGTTDVHADAGSSVTAGSMNMSADGFGGADAGAGAGNGTGGTARLRAIGTGSSVAIANVVTTGTLNQRDFLSVEGYGGQTNGGGSGIGGTGTGGSLTIQGTSGGTLTLPTVGALFGVQIMARGYGGGASGNGTTGGLGQGGTLTLALDNASLTSGPLQLSAYGVGGNAVGTGNITGGNGVGGTRSISAVNGSTLTFSTPAGYAGGGGGDGSGTGNGGNASGGSASLLVDNSTVNFTAASVIITETSGGNGATGGNASGGTSSVTIRNGGIVNVANDPSVAYDLLVGSDTYGGIGTGAAGNGGNASAGNVNLALQGGTLNLTGGMLVSAQAFGGDAIGSGSGGNATGGSASVLATGANNSITGPGTASLSANASGGESVAGNGGNGTAGLANVSTATGATLTVGSPLVVTASGFGGGGGTVGGSGFGGTARIFAANGSSLTIGGLAQIEANGVGGGIVAGSGNGGLGDGGVAEVYSAGGAITFNNNVTVSASATGGNASGGIGGNALGGSAKFGTDVGDISVSGNLTLIGSATGGAGNSGGNATALVSPSTNEVSPVAVSIYAGNGGSITVNGQANLVGRALGGAGINGNGGNGTAGEADVVAYVGDIDLNSLSIDVDGKGGNGGNGGNGGTGRGGVVDATFGLGSAPVNGTITLGSATIAANGSGGNGGVGIANNFGGDGGNGGAGFGGSILFAGSAAGGTLNSGAAVLTAGGTGGRGGNGGNGDSGNGGDGGFGGNGTGGFIQTGTISQSESSGSGGGVVYSTLSINTSATGGRGGNGGSGGGGNGVGGDGGNAAGGHSSFLIRGVSGTATSVSLIANATGGNGGSGSTAGDGGDARTGIIEVESKDRFDVPTQRGTLFANSIIGNAVAIGGTGATMGTSTVVDGSYFRVLNGSATIGSVSITVSGNLIDPTFGPSFVSVRSGTATIGAFNFVTAGTLSLDANDGAMNAGSIALNADNFVPHTANPVATNPGTYFANSFNIQTDNNFLTTAHLDSVQTLTIVAPGAIQIGNVTGDNSIVLEAQDGEVDIGNVLAGVGLSGGGIDIDASTFILTGNIAGKGIIDFDAGTSIGTGSILNTGNTSLNAGTSIEVGSINSGSGRVSLVTNTSYISGSVVVGGSIFADSGGDLFLDNLTAPGNIELVAIGDLSIGNALAGQTIEMDIGGDIDGGHMTAGDSFNADAGGSVALLDVSAGIVNKSTDGGADYNVGILSGSTIDTGDIAAFRSIGLGAIGNITTGTIDAGYIFLALSGGNMSFGTINADGTTYLADDLMIALAGDLSDGDDVLPILAATPVNSGGSITLRGAVTTGKFVAAASGTISGSTINSDSSIYASSGGNQTFTNLIAETSIYQRTLGTITENDLTAGSFIDIRSGGAMALGDLVAGDNIDLQSNNAIGLLTANAGETINFQTLGTLTGLTINAGNSVLGQAVGAIQLGAITAGITDPSTSPTAQYAARFSSGGAITTGNVNAVGRIGFGTPLTLNTGNLTSGGGIMALVSGNMTMGALNTGTGGYVYLANHSMAPLGGAFLTFNRTPILAQFPVATGGSITINGPVTTGNFRAAAGTTFNAGNITSTTNILIDSGGNMTLGNLIAGLNVSNVEDDNAIRFNSGGSIVMGNAIARDSIDFDANGSVTGGNLTSGRSVAGSADGAIILGNLSGGIVNPSGLDDDGFSVGMSSGTSVTVGNVIGAESVGFASLGSVTTGTINAANDFLVMATGNMSFGAITVGGRVYLADSSMYLAASEGGDGDGFDAALVFAANPVASVGSITAGAINAGSVQAAAGTTFNVGTIVANGRVALSSGGAMQTQAVTAGTSLRMTSGSTINGGNLTAGTLVRVSAAGAVNVGNITITNNVSGAAPDGGPLFDVGTGPPVEVFGASIATGNIATPGYVGLYTPGSLTVGTITAGHDVIALVGTNAAFGAIKTPERFFLGGYSMFALASGGESFNPALVFGAPKAKTGGSASFAGASTAASFQAYVGTDTTLQSLQTSGFALIDTGGMFSLNGTLGGNSRVISNDIALGATSAINGEVHLTSRNATQTLIGDGLDALGQGYRLSDAEADRINAVFTIAADTAYGAAAKMIIGDLSINVAGTSSSEFEYGFGTINRDSDDASVGSIRVVGDVVFSGMGQFDEVAFDTNLFQLDAATGSIALFGAGTTLGGTLALYAPRIWIASGDILAKLEANSTYSGYIAELNAPAAVQRPEGVLRAGSIDIDSGEEALQSLLVQNTGTTALPAGFLTTTADIDGEENIEPAAGSVNLVINGQLITEGGTLTGLAVRDFLVTEFGSAAFVAGSTINGCVLVGPCGSAPPRVDTLVATDVQLTTNSGLGDGLFGNEGDIDDGESGDGGDRSSPISPPNPLFDSRPLVQSGDVDDPVSGAGNPSLYDDTSDEDAKAEDCDSSKDNNCKTGKKGDGK